MVERLRLVKDPTELELINRAVHIADMALTAALRELKPGITERALARTLENLMVELGAEGPAFETIVASGPRSSLPHARPSDRPLGPHEPVIIDMGARYSGYNSDMTRTFFIGGPDDHGKRIYRVVLRAQQEAEAGLRAGLTGSEADKLARSVIEAEGLGEAFGHGLGHGIGLEVHEAPRLSYRSNEVLQPGSTVTVEPGIYLPGWGGVRIEDLVVLLPERNEVLTRTPKPEDGNVSEIVT
jgi:Xaa-Pro aminopeptidase